MQRGGTIVANSVRPANYGRWRRGEVGTNGRNQKKNSICQCVGFFEGLLTNKVRAMYKVSRIEKDY